MRWTVCLLARVVWVFSYITWMFGYDGDFVYGFSQKLEQIVRWKKVVVYF